MQRGVGYQSDPLGELENFQAVPRKVDSLNMEPGRHTVTREAIVLLERSDALSPLLHGVATHWR